MNRKKLEIILMQEDVVKSINNHINVLLDLIPEINDMIGFEHNHPHHHLDVWNHTLLALSRAPLDFEIRLVLLLHDIGKPHSYQDEEIRHFKGHPLVSSNMAKEILKRLSFDEDEIEELCFLIKEHDTRLNYSKVNENKYINKKLFKIQLCDALAHHPDKLERRINYLLDINEILNIGEERARYKHMLETMRKVIR